MKKVTFAILGVGNRGTAYASKLLRYPDDAQIVAIADASPIRTASLNTYIHLPESAIYAGSDEIFAAGKLADVMIIATQDNQHREHALRAMELGYDLILEKPISNKLEDITVIADKAKELGRTVLVCHVLRYTPFYRTVKRLLDEGVVGNIHTVQATEDVGYYHIAHSYVRGNWHKLADSSPMILAKCSHDMDILIWLTNKHCQKLTSFGSLDHFVAANAPEGSTERCADCPLDCPYHANRFYIGRIPGWPSNVLHPQPTPENITEILKTTNYGKCVYRMDNDVVDHQVVNMLLDDGVTVTFQMNGFNNIQTRTLRIMGSKGELWGDFHAKELYYRHYGKEAQKVDFEMQESSGHGGGDLGLIHDAIRYFRGDDFDTTAVTTIDRSVESHYMAFAAESSRIAGGELVNMDEYLKQVRKGE